MLEQIKKLSLFNNIDSNVLINLVNNKQIIKNNYKKSVTLHEQHSECMGIDVVLSGKLVAYSLATNGAEVIVFEFNKDSIIGANLLFGNQNKYPMNIYCTTDCSVFHISKLAVCELLKNHIFVMQFIKSLSLNSQGMNKKIAMLTQKSLRENLMDYFLALSAAQKTKAITLPISKKQLADYLGVQRPSLFRELKHLKDEGIIEINNKIIVLNFLDYK